jgi:hypothetical protein
MTLFQPQLVSQCVPFRADPVQLSGFDLERAVRSIRDGLRFLGRSWFGTSKLSIYIVLQLCHAVIFLAKLRVANPLFLDRLRLRSKAESDQDHQTHRNHACGDRSDMSGREPQRQGPNRGESRLRDASRWQRWRRRWWTREVHSASGTLHHRTQRPPRHIHAMRTSWARNFGHCQTSLASLRHDSQARSFESTMKLGRVEAALGNAVQRIKQANA